MLIHVPCPPCTSKNAKGTRDQPLTPLLTLMVVNQRTVKLEMEVIRCMPSIDQYQTESVALRLCVSFRIYTNNGSGRASIISRLQN